MPAYSKSKTFAMIFLVSLSLALVVFAAAKTAQESAAPQPEVFAEGSFTPPSAPPADEIPEQTYSATVRIEDEPLYVIRLVGNELRLTAYSDEENYTVLQSADPRTFREQDRLRLIDGVDIYTYEQLAAIIEDFSS